MFHCMKVDYNKLSDDEKMSASNQLTRIMIQWCFRFQSEFRKEKLNLISN